MIKVNGNQKPASVLEEIVAAFEGRIETPLRIIIAGAPAAGKGTQCELIKKKYGVVHISTGDLLRAAVRSGNSLGRKAEQFMNSGQLVPDQLIIDLVKQRLSSKDCQERGWLLDGFPRTNAQVQALASAGITADHFVLVDVPDEALVDRVLGRRLDPKTGKIYHMKFNPPPAAIVSRLTQRADDTAEKIKVRIKNFHAHIHSVEDSYSDIMIKVNGNQAPKAVMKEIVVAFERPKTALRIIIAGAPAAGKGTQCELIKQKYGVVHISTGDLLRAAVRSGTELGNLAERFMNSGQLVPDQLIIDLVKQRLSRKDCQERGWLLDGFPRTNAQAQALASAGITADHFVLVDVPDEILVERVLGRRMDPKTGKIYHLKFNPPPAAIVSRLTQRADDTAEKIKVRIKNFHTHIRSVQDSYANIMITVNGNQAPKAVGADIVAAFEGKKARSKL